MEASETVVITLTMPRARVEQIDRFAGHENRSRASYIRNIVYGHVDMLLTCGINPDPAYQSVEEEELTPH